MMGSEVFALGRHPLSARKKRAVLLSAIITACISAGGAQSPPESEGGPDLEIIPISGTERLSWNQATNPEFDIEAFRFVAFVDGAPADLRDVTCPPSPGGASGFACSARLPAMTRGTHAIEVSAYIDQADRLSNPRSWPIRVDLASATRGLAASVSGESFVTADGVRLRASVLASGLENPSDILTLPDGRVLVSELGGRVRILRDGALAESPALTLTDVTTGQDRGLLAVVADREFETTHAVFLLYTTTSGLRLARFSESNGILSGRAILLDGLPISDSRPSATLKMGPDGKLYLGLDNGGDANHQGDLGSFSGKVLRLNKDGTAPQDQAAGTPIYATGLGRPTGMGWSETGNTLWLAGRDADGPDQLQAFARGISRGARGLRYTLPAGVSASTLAIYRSSAIPALRGNIFVADAASGSILRVRVDSAGAPAETEWLFRGQFDAIRAISVAPDGSLYVATSDAVVRIVPDGSR
jgi:aldose sugar dehydrogenase